MAEIPDLPTETASAPVEVPSFLRERGRKLKDGTYLVQGPDGTAGIFTPTGQRVKSPEMQALEAKQQAAQDREDTLNKVVTVAQSGAQNLLPQVAGLKAALSGPEEGAGDRYRAERDATKREADTATERSGVGYQLLGGLTGAVGAPETMAARLALAGGLGAVNAAASSDVDLTKSNADLGQFAKDTAEGGALGLGAGAVGEAVGAGLRKAGGIFKGKAAAALEAQAAKDMAAVEKEIASLQGQLGAETQKGSRFVENVQRGAGGVEHIPGATDLVQGVLDRTEAKIPGQLAKIEGIEAELAAKTAGKDVEAAKRTADYFASSVFKTEVAPRLRTLAPRFGMSALAAAGGAGYDIATGGDGGKGLAAGFSGSVLGAPGVRQMLKNVASSPRVQMAVASRLAPLLQSAAVATARGLTPGLRDLATVTLHESHLGEPQLAAEQLMARGGLNSVIGKHPPDVAHEFGLAEAASPLDKAIKQTVGVTMLAGAIDDHHAKEDAAIEQALKGVKEPPSARNHDMPTDLSRLASDPEALLERVTNNVAGIHGVAPTVAQHLVATGSRAVQYLQSVATTPPRGGPLAPEWAAGGAEKAHLRRAAEVVSDPTSVLRHAAAGTLTREHMDALQAVYPVAARAMQDKVIAKIADGKAAKVPYRQRLMVHLLTGVDADGTVASTAANQRTFAQASSKPSNAGAPSAKSAKGAEKLTLAERTAMPGSEAKKEARK